MQLSDETERSSNMSVSAPQCLSDFEINVQASSRDDPQVADNFVSLVCGFNETFLTARRKAYDERVRGWQTTRRQHQRHQPQQEQQTAVART
jgi:hypothetical protein